MEVKELRLKNVNLAKQVASLQEDIKKKYCLRGVVAFVSSGSRVGESWLSMMIILGVNYFTLWPMKTWLSLSNRMNAQALMSSTILYLGSNLMMLSILYCYIMVLIISIRVLWLFCCLFSYLSNLILKEPILFHISRKQLLLMGLMRLAGSLHRKSLNGLSTS